MILSTSGFVILPKNCLAKEERLCANRLCPSAKRVSKASDDFPEPEIPVIIETPEESPESAADRATEERHRRFLLGKKVVRPVTTASGFVIAEMGATVTEEILQKAKLANKIVDLSMNVQ